LFVDGDDEQFCCNGCRTVYEVIQTSGLERFYALRRDEIQTQTPGRATGRRYEEFDDESFRERCCRRLENGSARPHS